MSMLSSQVDELRELATRYDELQVGAVRAVTMPPNMGSILRDAADTIWELRDDLQRANTENAKLRELVLDMYHCSDPCNDCPHYNGSNSGFYCGLGIGWKARRMHELGIEVDG